MFKISPVYHEAVISRRTAFKLDGCVEHRESFFTFEIDPEAPMDPVRVIEMMSYESMNGFKQRVRNYVTRLNSRATI